MSRYRLIALLVSLALLTGCTAALADGKKHPAEEKGLKSTSGDVEASVKFVNKSKQTVKVYWLDYDGERKLYQTLKEDESYDQMTYLTHPWLVTDENDNAWYVYFPDAQPRTVEIAAPEKK
jgi:hypothetical protein